jgi:hypothetical protein
MWPSKAATQESPAQAGCSRDWTPPKIFFDYLSIVLKGLIFSSSREYIFIVNN